MEVIRCVLDEPWWLSLQNLSFDVTYDHAERFALHYAVYYDSIFQDKVQRPLCEFYIFRSSLKATRPTPMCHDGTYF